MAGAEGSDGMDFAAGTPCGGALMRPRQRHEQLERHGMAEGGERPKGHGMMRRRESQSVTKLEALVDWRQVQCTWV